MKKDQVSFKKQSLEPVWSEHSKETTNTKKVKSTSTKTSLTWEWISITWEVPSWACSWASLPTSSSLPSLSSSFKICLVELNHYLQMKKSWSLSQSIHHYGWAQWFHGSSSANYGWAKYSCMSTESMTGFLTTLQKNHSLNLNLKKIGSLKDQSQFKTLAIDINLICL